MISQGFVGVLPAVLGALCGMLQASEELDTQAQVRGCKKPEVKAAHMMLLLAFVFRDKVRCNEGAYCAA
jgi:hypothetical protein